jgi:predicted ATP-dependent endonuclease of OLD family
MEEPENGIHPERLESMVDLVRGLAVDPKREPSEDNPFRQVIVNTHSPAFVQLQNPPDLLFAKPVTIRGPSGKMARTIRLMPLHKTWRTGTGKVAGIGKIDILAYLTKPTGSQLTFDDYAA